MNAIPKEVRVDDSSLGLTIFVSWYNDGLFFSVFFSTIWTFLFVYFVMLDDWLLFQVVGSVFSIIGLCLIYYSVCGFVNHTRIDVLDSELTRTYGGPLPWPKRTVSVPVSEIAAVYNRKSTTTHSDATSDISSHNTYTTRTSYKVGISTGKGGRRLPGCVQSTRTRFFHPAEAE